MTTPANVTKSSRPLPCRRSGSAKRATSPDNWTPFQPIVAFHRQRDGTISRGQSGVANAIGDSRPPTASRSHQHATGLQKPVSDIAMPGDAAGVAAVSAIRRHERPAASRSIGDEARQHDLHRQYTSDTNASSAERAAAAAAPAARRFRRANPASRIAIGVRRPRMGCLEAEYDHFRRRRRSQRRAPADRQRRPAAPRRQRDAGRHAGLLDRERQREARRRRRSRECDVRVDRTVAEADDDRGQRNDGGAHRCRRIAHTPIARRARRPPATRGWNRDARRSCPTRGWRTSRRTRYQRTRRPARLDVELAGDFGRQHGSRRGGRHVDLDRPASPRPAAAAVLPGVTRAYAQATGAARWRCSRRRCRAARRNAVDQLRSNARRRAAPSAAATQQPVW